MRACTSVAVGWVVFLLLMVVAAPLQAGEGAGKQAGQEKKAAGKPAAASDDKTGGEKKAEDAAPEAARPATHTLAKGPLKIEVTLEGTFEAQKTAEIVIRPEEWQTLTVQSALEHGTAVKRGDVLATLDLEKIDRASADLRAELKTSEISIKQAEQELRTLETLTPLDLAAADRARNQANEDLELYSKVFRPLNQKMLDFTLKLAKLRFDYATEELQQLEKMYQADDLTEETEEIVLKRARAQVEFAKFSYESAKVQHEDALKRDLPRTAEKIEEATKRANIAWEKTRVIVPAALERQRLDLEKLKLQRERSEERLRKLSADREAMIVKSPTDGILYYGICDRGKWTNTSGEQLSRGTALQPNKVVMTVVEPRPMFVRVTIPEKQLHNVRAGVTGTIKPTAEPETRLRGILQQVGSVPLSGGGFDGRVTVALDDKAARLMPGMTGEVKLLAYEKKDALTAPVAAVAAEETDEQKHYVMVVGKDGTPQKRPVKVGKRTDKVVEILSGVKEGDEILPEAPKDKEKPAAKDKK